MKTSIYNLYWYHRRNLGDWKKGEGGLKRVLGKKGEKLERREGGKGERGMGWQKMRGCGEWGRGTENRWKGNSQKGEGGELREGGWEETKGVVEWLQRRRRWAKRGVG
jgi:hypothetical protein